MAKTDPSAGETPGARVRHWRVEVYRDGENVVNIESNCLSGRELQPGDEEVIRDAAMNLLGFIGEPREAADQLGVVPPVDLREAAKDLYAEGLQVGIELGRGLGRAGAGGPSAGDSGGADSIDDIHTGDDDLLDTLTGIRAGVESLRDDEIVREDPDGVIDDLLAELDKADALRVAQLKAAGDVVPPSPASETCGCEDGVDCARKFAESLAAPPSLGVPTPSPETKVRCLDCGASVPIGESCPRCGLGE